MTDSSLLNLSYHSAGKFATGPPSRAINMRTRITQPSGAATPRNSDAYKHIAVLKALCVLLEYTRPRPKSGKVRRSDTRPGNIRERAERSEGSDTTPIRNDPCFAVCAIVYGSLSKAECIPLSPAKANVGHLCEKLKNGMRSSLEQHCGGNFLPIFAGTLLDEKPNFTGRFFGWRKPFENITR